MFMFVQNKCLVQYCNNNALSTFDADGNLTEEKSYCLDHIPNPGAIKEQIYNYINTHEKIIGLNACGMIFSDISFTNKQFIGCNFSHCTFTNLHSEDTKIRMSVFDYTVFNNCNFIHSHSMFTSFSQCTFTHSLFTSSDFIQNNFNCIKAYQSSFDDSDMFNSRFIKATLYDTSFRNCNIKKANFTDSKRTNVSFKMSNTREAEFEVSGGTGFETGLAPDNPILATNTIDGGL